MKMEALERRGKTLAIAGIIFIVFWSQCRGVDGHRNSTKMSYVCPPHFIRLGHSCYFFSDTEATWQNALFTCKDRDSNLSVPARWEDRNLRNYLNRPDVEKSSRWIGGIYDYADRTWKWGGELREMHYQSFSKMEKLTPEQLQWHCIGMIPELLFRWAPRNCYESRKFICQTKLKKVPKSKVKDYRRRWQRMGNINEIIAPSVSREVGDPAQNDVTASPILNPKSYDLRPSPLRRGPHPKPGSRRNNTNPYNIRPNELKKRARPTVHRKLRRPYPGYKWNRNDPENSYLYNENLLNAGRTGLTPQQVKVNLARLKHMRDRQIAKRKLKSMGNDWLRKKQQPLAQVQPRTYTVDTNISALHPKTIVEEFDMMPPPASIVLPRPTRGVYYRG